MNSFILKHFLFCFCVLLMASCGSSDSASDPVVSADDDNGIESSDGGDGDGDGDGDSDGGATSEDKDIDLDDFTINEGDCNDLDENINPDAVEITGNSIDENCDDIVADVDDDGFNAIADGGLDADDNDPSIFPGAPEICGDNKDNNQEGQIDEGCVLDVDDDGDGFDETQGDCNDSDDSIHPDATEVFGNTVDEDCSGYANDQDGDNDDASTASTGGGDCDDNDDTRSSLLTEVIGNAIDEDCSGYANDQDNDGFDGIAAGSTDCNDTDDTVRPDAIEVIDDNIDQNCDGIQGWTFTKFYADVISPSCTSSNCHDATDPKLGLDMSTKSNAYTNLVNVNADQSPLDIIEPGDADASYVIHKLEGTQASLGQGSGQQMPRTGCCLPQATINELRDWIDAGAIND